MLILITWKNGNEEDSSKACILQRGGYMVKYRQLLFYEDHLGADRLKTSKPFRRHALCALSDAWVLCPCITWVVPRYIIVPLALAEGTFNIWQNF